jgi:carboxylesterase type B
LKPVLIGNTENEMAMFMVGSPAGALLGDKSSQKQMSSVFSCPASNVAKGRSAYVPVWRYSYAGDFPNQFLSKAVTGPYHGSEIGLVMGTSELTRIAPDVPSQVALGKKMREAWLAFAKNPEKGLDGILPKYDPTSK